MRVPTDEQIERAAHAICIARGEEPHAEIIEVFALASRARARVRETYLDRAKREALVALAVMQNIGYVESMHVRRPSSAGGVVVTPPHVDERHVLLANSKWRLRSSLQPHEPLHITGGCVLIGNGQLVPVEAV